MERKKILIIHHGSGLGGGLVALLGLIDELKLSFDVSVFCIFNSEAIKAIENKKIKVYLPHNLCFYKKYNLFIHSAASYPGILNFAKSLYNFLLASINAILFSKRELKAFEKQYDIIYLNSLFISDWLPAARRYFNKVVVHVREPLANGTFGLRKKLFIILLKKFTDLIIFVSEDNKNRINIKEKSTRVYDPVVTSDRTENVNIDHNKDFKYFIYLGGSQRIKGFEQIIKSLEFLNEDIRIFFLGPTYELKENYNGKFFKVKSVFSRYLRKELPVLLQMLKSSIHIIEIGNISNVFDYYNKSIAVICPFSKPHACLPMLEAYSVGKSVIISDIEGMKELYLQDVTYEFPNGAHQELAKIINKVSLLSQDELAVIEKKSTDFYRRIRSNNPSITNLLNKL